MSQASEHLRDEELIAKERRERERRERDRQRSQAPRPKAALRVRASARGSEGSSLAKQHREGLVGWLARSFRDFAAEVIVILRSIGGFLPRVMPWALRARVRATAQSSSTSVRHTPRVPSIKARRPAAPRSAAQMRVAAERRERLRSRVRILISAALVVSVIAAWLVVPASKVFNIRHVEVSGTRSIDDLDIREKVDSLLRSQTIYTVDEEKLVKRLESLPFVKSVELERHIPGGLQINITEYRPLALAYGQGDFWLVSHDGRVLAKADGKAWRQRIPTVELEGDRKIKPGVRLDDEPALKLLDELPKSSTLQFDTIRTDQYRLEATLLDGTEVRFGRPDLLLLKVVALERVLELSARHGEDLLYVDVSVPARPTRCLSSNFACHLPRGRVAAKASTEDTASAPTTPEEIGGDEADLGQLQ